VLLGILISVNLEQLVHVLERVLNTHFLDPSVYFMSDLPALVETDTCCGSRARLRAVLLSTLYSRVARRAYPAAEALRHE